jgi:fumarate reductase subunit D
MESCKILRRYTTIENMENRLYHITPICITPKVFHLTLLLFRMLLSMERMVFHGLKNVRIVIAYDKFIPYSKRPPPI